MTTPDRCPHCGVGLRKHCLEGDCDLWLDLDTGELHTDGRCRDYLHADSGTALQVAARMSARASGRGTRSPRSHFDSVGCPTPSDAAILCWVRFIRRRHSLSFSGPVIRWNMPSKNSTVKA